MRNKAPNRFIESKKYFGGAGDAAAEIGDPRFRVGRDLSGVGVVPVYS
jgi:hypothetical protein